MAELKQIARRIFHETLGAIDIPLIMQQKLTLDGTRLQCRDARIDLGAFEKVRAVAIGKATHALLDGLRLLLPPEIGFDGIAAAPTPTKAPVAGMKYFVAGHPVPNEESWKAAEAILALLKTCDEKSLVFFLLSGGGSALAELPLDPQQTLRDVQQLNHSLVTCGASIEAINTIRKHVSAVKGGRLAVCAERATKITLAVSDVPVGRESALASGPTLPDPTSLSDFDRTVSEFGLWKKFPRALQKWIEEGNMPETPKTSHAAFRNARFSLVLDMEDLFHHAHLRAEAKGCVACCDNSTDEWPVDVAAEFLLEQLENHRRENAGHQVVLIADGELSSPVTGNGVGGRNSAFVLACVDKIAGKKIAVLSAGTDGLDGNSPAAGAVADGETMARAAALRLDAADYFRRSDAHTYFEKLGDALVTGPTGNNLRDLRVLIAEG
jgi:glycerate 2-kinase